MALAFEFAVARNNYVVPGCTTVHRLAEMNSPAVVFMGSSLFAEAIDTDLAAERLRLTHLTDAVRADHGHARAADFNFLVREHLDGFEEDMLVFFAVSPLDLNDNYLLIQKDLSYTGFRQRRLMTNGATLQSAQKGVAGRAIPYGEFAAKGLWKTLEARQTLSDRFESAEWWGKWWRGEKAKRVPLPERAPRKAPKPRPSHPIQVDRSAKWLLRPPYDASEANIALAVDTTRLLVERGCRVVFVSMPIDASLEKAIQASPTLMADWAKWIDARDELFREVEEAGASTSALPASFFRLRREHFAEDGIHMNATGKFLFSYQLDRLIASLPDGEEIMSALGRRGSELQIHRHEIGGPDAVVLEASPDEPPPTPVP